MVCHYSLFCSGETFAVIINDFHTPLSSGEIISGLDGARAHIAQTPSNTFSRNMYVHFPCRYGISIRHYGWPKFDVIYLIDRWQVPGFDDECLKTFKLYILAVRDVVVAYRLNVLSLEARLCHITRHFICNVDTLKVSVRVDRD